MTQEKAVVVIEDRQVAIQELETRFAMAVKQRELLENYIKQRLHPGKHYYKIERVGDEARGGQQKPSLTKEGAELICLPHSLKPRYEWLSGPDNPPLDDSPYQITMKCILERNSIFEGEGVGSASSMVTKKDGTRVQRQRDPGLRHNATIKMACKSAYIAATLNATAASEFFTQDMEDDNAGEDDKPERKGHYCQLHKTVFFKKGRMKGYAHPILDENGKPTGEWCNEGEAKAQEEGKEESQAEPSDVQPEMLGFIDKAWLREQLNILQSKKLSAWTNRNLLSYLNNITGQQSEKVADAVKLLNKEQAEALVLRVREAVELA